MTKYTKPIPSMNVKQLQRFASKFVINSDGCWKWNAAVHAEGYAIFWLKDQTYSAHRLVYKNVFGDIPAELELDHICRVKSCVNPGHLEAVTALENVKRANAAGIEKKYKTPRYKVKRVTTTCKNGHVRDELNTKVVTRGTRTYQLCRVCFRKKQKVYYYARQALNKA